MKVTEEQYILLSNVVRIDNLLSTFNPIFRDALTEEESDLLANAYNLVYEVKMKLNAKYDIEGQ